MAEPVSWKRRLARSPLVQLTLLRFRYVAREPGSLFISFGIPIVLCVMMAVAFSKDTQALPVLVADGPGAEAIIEKLNASNGVRATRGSLADARQALSVGKASLVLVPGEPPEMLFDSNNWEARSARLWVKDALERPSAGPELQRIRERPVPVPRSRYIDFFIPGMIGYNMMTAGFWGFAYALARMREGKLLKRLTAAPMNRLHFLSSFMITRLVLAVAELAVILGFTRVVFGARVTGSIGSFVALALLGTAVFSALGFTIASRSENAELLNGRITTTVLILTMVSGVFFPTTHFPDVLQPLLRLLPLNALNEGLRAIALEGTPLAGLGRQLLILAGWGGLSFAAALRLFRWT